jgi:thiol-disulfide isomerase/thioredoxin
VFAAYTLFTIVRDMARRKYIVPKQKKEWTGLFSDVFFLGLTVFLLNMIANNYEKPMEAVMQFKGKELPAFSYYNFNSGREEVLAEQSKRIIILNIWATWCPPCRKEMPELDELQKSFAGKGVLVLALSDESPDVINQYLSKNKFSFQSGYFSKSNNLINSINTRPVSILLVDGKVVDIVVGARGFGFFSDWIKDQLNN